MTLQITDAELLMQFRTTDRREESYTILIRRYQERLYWHIRRIVIDHDDANDILQNVFIKVWKSLDGFREDSQLFTWLYRIATNESITFLNSKKKRFYLPIEDVAKELKNKLTTSGNFSESKTELKLQEAILSLPEKQRIVFNLRYYDEMPYEEMSRVLGTSEGALKASFHHAVKKVEKFLLAD
ncbi:DNA-directed RNA polymerase sigma-70 factor [Bacteroidota bacterium]|nr:DNA-directed RNA polymerase sigma-70 factor [Bacteroidota bacterium]